MRNIEGDNFALTGQSDTPVNLDYDIQGLHKKRIIEKGELLTVEYYRTYDGVTYSDLVVRETRTYTRNQFGIATSREMIIEWLFENGTIGCTKTTIKYYKTIEGIDEGLSRRANIIGEAKLYVLSQVGLVNGQDFLNSVPQEVNLFINGSTQPLRDAVQASSKTYITQAMKGVVVTILTF